MDWCFGVKDRELSETVTLALGIHLVSDGLTPYMFVVNPPGMDSNLDKARGKNDYVGAGQ